MPNDSLNANLEHCCYYILAIAVFLTSLKGVTVMSL